MMNCHGGIFQFDGESPDEGLLVSLQSACGKFVLGNAKLSLHPAMAFFHGSSDSIEESVSNIQPYVTQSGLVIVWDGRLDNRSELFTQMGCDPSESKTDVAIVGALYDQHITDCFSRLLGDWALTVWDPRARTLHLAVDYMGLRQIYYVVQKCRLLWCSHLEPLVRSGALELTIDDEYIAGYLASFPEPHLTPFSEIRAVTPGTVLQVRRDEKRVWSYWSFDSIRPLNCRSDKEYEVQFVHLFRQAVRRRLQSDFPIAAELSGGLDSSSIVCMADDLLCRGECTTPVLRTVSYVSDCDPEGDDPDYLRLIEEKRRMQGCHILLGEYFSLENGTFSATPRWIGDRPEFEANLRTFLRTNGIRALLSGVGGDEFLGGIPNPRPLLADLIASFSFIQLADQLIKWSLVKRMPWLHLLVESGYLLLPNRFQKTFVSEGNVASWVDSRLARHHGFAEKQMGLIDGFQWLRPSFRDGIQTAFGLRRQLGYSNAFSSALVEHRYPYLDRNLVEFLLAIPSSQLLRPGERRSLMRRALQGWVPVEVLSRKSKSIVAHRPLAAFVKHWTDLEELFRSAVSAELGYIDSVRFKEALLCTRNGARSDWMRILRVVSLEVWLRNVLELNLVNTPVRTPPLAVRNMIPSGA